MTNNTCDLLAVGAHPDDIEIGMGATIAKYVAEGYTCQLLTLTKAELSSNGDVETRQLEAQAAADTLGVKKREQLSLKDRGLALISPTEKLDLVRRIREWKPRFVFTPLPDRHPDHGACAAIIKDVLFDAGIRNLLPEYEPHKVEAHFSYFINGFSNPDFVIDVAHVYDKKIAALQAYQSQFQPQAGVSTPLTDQYIESVSARDRMYAKEVGLTYAEGFKTYRPLNVTNLFER